jgi:CRISPR/Cas system CSM-associated protein Csm2 small subunit
MHVYTYMHIDIYSYICSRRIQRNMSLMKDISIRINSLRILENNCHRRDVRELQ